MRRTVFATPLVVSLVVVACAAPAPRAPTKSPAPVASSPPPILARACAPWTPAPAEEPEPVDPSYTPPLDRRPKPDHANDLCATADSNLAAAEKHVLADPGGPVAAQRVRDPKAKPAYWDRVAGRLSLTTDESERLAKNGFVVLAKQPFATYAWGLHEVYQSELPIWISADAILHAVYASNDHLLADIERAALVPLLGKTLGAMHCALGEAGYPQEVLRDLDLYLTVARSLLADAAVPSVLGVDAEAEALVALAKKAEGVGPITIFGRDRVVDWSAYQPRGHYAPADRDAEVNGGGVLTAYFRAATWLSRLEMNVVSRSSRSSIFGSPDPRETPREAVDALALADLTERARVTADVARLDRAWALLAGRREDISVADMLALRKKAGIHAVDGGAFERLKAAIGPDFQRTARTHPMPEGATVLPAIATFLGPRVVADAAAFRPLVHTEVPGRYMVGAGDAAYVLGLDRGKAYLKDDLATYPTLGAHLDDARQRLVRAPDAGDLYGAWLGALRGVATKPEGVLPSFMSTPAYDDLRMSSLVAGYAQIRHNYVLMAAQSYDEGGCEIPDGYVEPLPAVYEGVARYADRGASVVAELDPTDTLKARAYFAELGKVSRVLATIARHELEGRVLTTNEKRFLSMVVEMSPGSTGSAPTYTGWYFDVFRGRWQEALGTAELVADFHTSAWTGKVAYVGAMEPRLGVFVVDAGGAPRLAVGPVARGYELTGGVDQRYSDASVKEVPDKKEPWAASYTAPVPAAPAVAVAATFPFEDGHPVKLGVRVAQGAPKVVIELLDHHRRPLPGAVTRTVPAGKLLLVRMPLAKAGAVEGVRVRIGAAVAEDFTHGPNPGVSIQSGGVTLSDDDWQHVGN